jgi:hypothetical protein
MPVIPARGRQDNLVSDQQLRRKLQMEQSPRIMGRQTLLPSTALGPHSSKKKQDLDKLYELKSKARQIMNQFGPSALINPSNVSSIKPERASTLYKAPWPIALQW